MIMKDKQIIILLLIALGIVILLFSYLYYYIKNKIDEKKEITIFANSNNKQRNNRLKLYRFFSKWKPSKNYIKKLHKKFSILMPSDNISVMKKTIETSLIMWGIDCIIIVILFILQPSFYTGVLTILFIYISNTLYIHIVLDKMEIKLLKQFDKWVKDIRYNYQVHEMIDESIYETIDYTKYPMKLHAHQLFKVLDSDNVEMEAEKYNEDVPNRFLKIFLAICILIQNFGDKRVENQSVFLTNLKYLRQEIEIEIINREKIKYMFSGLIFLTIIPILTTKGIEKWAISSFEDLDRFYDGRWGIMVLFLIFLFTICSYQTIMKLKEHKEFDIEENFYLKILATDKRIDNLLDKIINKNYGRYLKTKELLKNNAVPLTGREFLLKRIIYSLIGFMITIILFIYIHIKTKTSYFKWYELIIGILISIISYNIPYIILKLTSNIRQMQMEDEVIQFHSIILMLMHIDTMTIEIILEWLESFSQAFKRSLQKAINNLDSGELEALEELKKEETFEPFVRIIENIEICDRIPIYKAFDEIAADRLNYQEKRKLENEKHTKDKAVIAKVLAWIPFTITIGFYLIIPFVVEGLLQLLNSIGDINKI